MSENNAPTVTPADLASAVGSGASNAAQSSAPNSNPAAESVDDLPEWAKKEIRSLRQENADRRARNSSLEAEITQVRNDLATKEATYAQQLSESALAQARYRAAVTSGVPADRIDDFASRLRGSTPEELAEDAANLAQLFKTNSTEHAPAQHGYDPSQGLGNSNPAPMTPAQQLGDLIAGRLGR